MSSKPTPIEAPQLCLDHCSVEEHCLALRELKSLSFWWYQGTSKLFGNYSLPYQDGDGRWWYQMKSGLSWPADFFHPFKTEDASPPFIKSYLGFQRMMANGAASNSHLIINTITDLGAYGLQTIKDKRRNAVRKGFRLCNLSVQREFDAETIEQCRQAWADLTQRTGWKAPVDKEDFYRTWQMLLGCPGVSIIVGREKESGQVAGFLVTKIIGNTAYVDTIASLRHLLKTNVNDALMYAFLLAAQDLPGVKMAHYAIKSTVTALERFKTGLGFQHVSFPAQTHLRTPVGFILRTFFRSKYDRMSGRFANCDP